MTQEQVLAMIADHDAKVRPHIIGTVSMTGADELREMALMFRGWEERANRLRELAAEYDRMERELTRLMQEGREAHAAITNKAI